MEYLYKEISEKIKLSRLNWKEEPFPHLVIDNFFPKNIFSKITETILNNQDNFKDAKKIYNTDLEFRKETFGDNDLNEYLKLPIEIMGGEIIKNCIKNVIGEIDLISLNDFQNYGGYSPFHMMKSGGFLGSHIDHSRSINNDFHIANSIFYASPTWGKNDGGETLLFDKKGIKIEKFIDPKPNRLIVFLHSAESFHGVNIISEKSNYKRYSYYMDYYIKGEKIKNSNYNSIFHNYKDTYCDHSTTFIPSMPLGLKSFNLKSLFKIKTYYPYLYVYLKYLFNKNFKKIKFN